MTGAQSAQRPALPTSARVVAIVLMVGGGIYAVLGLGGVSNDDRATALLSMGLLVLGAACLLVGWRLLNGERWAFVAAVVLMSLAVIGVVGSAVSSGDRAIVAQGFLPALAIWLLVRPATREHFLRR